MLGENLDTVIYRDVMHELANKLASRHHHSVPGIKGELQEAWSKWVTRKIRFVNLIFFFLINKLYKNIRKCNKNERKKKIIILTLIWNFFKTLIVKKYVNKFKYRSKSNIRHLFKAINFRFTTTTMFFCTVLTKDTVTTNQQY